MRDDGPQPAPPSGWLERILDPPDLRAANARRLAQRPPPPQGRRWSATEMWIYGAWAVTWAVTGSLALPVSFIWAAADTPPGEQVDYATKNRNLLVALAGLLGPVSLAWPGVHRLRRSRWAALVVLAMLAAYAVEGVLLARFLEL